MQDPDQQAGANLLGSWIAQHLPPGTPVLCFPYAAHLYSCYNLRVPVRQILMPPGGMAPEVYPEIHRRLLEKQVNWLIYQHVDVAEVSGNYDIAPELLQKQWEDVRKQLTKGYHLMEGNEHLGLYKH